MHAAAIAATSDQLDALINGGMGEAEQRCAKFENTRVEDFIRFCEYAYRGDYTVPTGESTNQNDGDGVTILDTSDTADTKENKPSLPNNRKTTLNVILDNFKPKSNSTVDQNFVPVLLANARLYCFAHVHLVSGLVALTLEKLKTTLSILNLHTERVGDIIELARYVYSNPDLPDRTEDGTLDSLRKLVLDYIVRRRKTIGRSEDFLDLMEEGGEFVGDFWRLVRECVA